MSDLRERLAAAIREARFEEDDYANEYTLAEALRPLIEAELAQATADALEAVCDYLRESCNKNELHFFDKVIEGIRALIPADIAAKAKEREDAKDDLILSLRTHRDVLIAQQQEHDAELFAQWRNLALELLDEQRSIWGKGTYSAIEILDAVEKDLRADKEFSGCSEGPDLIEAIRESGGTGHTEAPQQREHDAKIRREAYLRCLAQVELAEESDGGSFLEPLISNFRKWANEPPSGGKADGGG